MPVLEVFHQCVTAIRDGSLIQRESRMDKEFHFQNWFNARLQETGLNFEAGGRNTYPDFRLVATTEGYEIKGLAYPGRVADFDSNSQIPSGTHNGRTIYYVFGRYPKDPDGNTYPVSDLVICHGDFLNADHEYVHKNAHVKGFGSYGDIMIRDRKMYVVPTPFQLIDGVAHQHTLVLPADMNADERFVSVGELRRREANELVVGYTFNLETNEMITEKIPNPSAGREHAFRAWRLVDSPTTAVRMRSIAPEQVVAEMEDETNEE